MTDRILVYVIKKWGMVVVYINLFPQIRWICVCEILKILFVMFLTEYNLLCVVCVFAQSVRSLIITKMQGTKG